LSIEQRIYDGNRAKEVLDNEVFQQVWADIEQGLIESWRSIPASDSVDHVKARERLHLSLTLLGKLKSTVEQTMQSGKLAIADLDYQEKKKLSERLGLGSWKL
jgi:hypothetical protein